MGSTWKYADRFGDMPGGLQGHVYRCFGADPEFKRSYEPWAVGSSCISLVLLPGGGGRLVVSSDDEKVVGSDPPVKVTVVPLDLRVDEAKPHPAKEAYFIDVVKFAGDCTIFREEPGASGKLARKIVNEFACDVLDDDEDWCLRIRPAQGGITFENEKSEGTTQTTLDTDIILTTPNCDELGHYLLRRTGTRVSADNVDAAVAEEAAAWEAILGSRKFMVGSRAKVLKAFESQNEEGGQLDAGLEGVITERDDDGDYNVDFGPGSGSHWVRGYDLHQHMIKVIGEQRGSPGKRKRSPEKLEASSG